LTQSTGFGPGPYELGSKKFTLKESLHQRNPQDKNPHKSPMGQGQLMGFLLKHENFIIF